MLKLGCLKKEKKNFVQHTVLMCVDSYLTRKHKLFPGLGGGDNICFFLNTPEYTYACLVVC